MKKTIAILILICAVLLKTQHVFATNNQQLKLTKDDLVNQLTVVATPVKTSASFNFETKTATSPIIIKAENATFIKVHFSDFAIPKGSRVIVANNDGTESYSYGHQDKSPLTIDSAIGDDGINQFSAMSISGDTAIVRLELGHEAWNPKVHHLMIDSYMKGFTESEVLLHNQEQINIRSTCGANERRDVMCWADSHPVEFERTRPVARILINGSSLCTAWRVGASNRMFTNNHCFSSASAVRNVEVWFNYQRSGCNSGSTDAITKVNGDTLLSTNYSLDYTLFTVANFASIQGFGHFGLDVRSPTLNERIYIPQHGSGNPKELAIESDRNASGLCAIDDVVANGSGFNTDTGYFCDTIGGSSGSPVLAAASNNVIALHHFGGCTNQGVRIDRIWPNVAEYFDNVIPVGDNSDFDFEPEAEFSFTSNGLVVTFNNTSSDVDGTIVSYDWDFGDGNTASTANPIHTYSSAGTYLVTLTVTDNDGLDDSFFTEVDVSLDTGPQLIVEGISGSERADTEVFTLAVGSNASNLTITLEGDNGDADLYVRLGQLPTYGSNGNYDCREISNGSNEECTIANPDAGTYFIVVRTWNPFNNVTLTAEYD